MPAHESDEKRIADLLTMLSWPYERDARPVAHARPRQGTGRRGPGYALSS